MMSVFRAAAKVEGTKIVAKQKERQDALDANATQPPPPPVLQAPPTIARVATLPPQLPPARDQEEERIAFTALAQQKVDLHYATSSERRLILCPGLQLELPAPVAMHYPWEIPRLLPQIGWTAPDEEGFVRSSTPRCLGEAAVESEPCASCELLKYNPLLQALVTRAWDTILHLGTSSDGYLTMAQRAKRLDHRRKLHANLRLQLMHANSKLRRLLKLPGVIERIMAALATGNVMRLHVVMRRLRKRNATPVCVAKMIERCAGGYVPKGDFERQDFQKAFLLLALGGQRALRINMATEGGPSRRSIFRTKLFQVPRHYTTVGPLLADQEHATRELCYHVRTFLEESLRAMPREELAVVEHKPAWHFLMDNVGNDVRLRYSTHPTFGGVQCIARESTFKGSTVIRSYNDFLVIKEALEKGEILLTQETTVLVAIRNSKVPAIVPLFSSGTAKLRGYGRGAQDQAFILKQASDVSITRLACARILVTLRAANPTPMHRASRFGAQKLKKSMVQ